MGDLVPFGDPADERHIRLDDVDRIRSQVLEKLLLAMEAEGRGAVERPPSPPRLGSVCGGGGISVPVRV
jgi:hypothetical protein